MMEIGAAMRWKERLFGFVRGEERRWANTYNLGMSQVVMYCNAADSSTETTPSAATQREPLIAVEPSVSTESYMALESFSMRY